jgi:hypothetical protein
MAPPMPEMRARLVNIKSLLGKSYPELSDRQKRLLVTAPAERVSANFMLLKRKRISPRDIVKSAHVLALPERQFEDSLGFLKKLRLPKTRFVRVLKLLGYRTETLKNAYEELTGKIGVQRRKVVLYPELLAIPKPFERYSELRSVLPKDEILKHPILLRSAKETVEGNVLFLSTHGIPRRPALLATAPSAKRMKVAWLLRELFDYGKLDSIDKLVAVEGVREILRKNPGLLLAKTSRMNERWTALASQHGREKALEKIREHPSALIR